MFCKWVHEERGHGSASLLLFLAASLSELLVHTRAGGTARALVWVFSVRTRVSSWAKLLFAVRVGRESATRCSAGPSGLDGLGSCCGTGRVEGG